MAIWTICSPRFFFALSSVMVTFLRFFSASGMSVPPLIRGLFWLHEGLGRSGGGAGCWWGEFDDDVVSFFVYVELLESSGWVGEDAACSDVVFVAVPGAFEDLAALVGDVLADVGGGHVF